MDRQASPTMTAATQTPHRGTEAHQCTRIVQSLPSRSPVHTLHAHKTQTQTTTTTTARFCIHAAAPQQAQRRLVHVDALELDEYMPTGQAARKRNAITSLLARQPASQPASQTRARTRAGA